jgi:hypothetical protein
MKMVECEDRDAVEVEAGSRQELIKTVKNLESRISASTI